MHRDEVVTRIRSAWGLQRAGNRIDSHVGMAISIAQSSRDVVRDGEFLSWSERDVVLRDRSGVASQSFRRIEMVPPAEIDVGLAAIIRKSLAATSDQAVIGEANPSASCLLCRIGDHLSSCKCAINTSVGVL